MQGADSTSEIRSVRQHHNRVSATQQMSIIRFSLIVCVRSVCIVCVCVVCRCAPNGRSIDQSISSTVTSIRRRHTFVPQSVTPPVQSHIHVHTASPTTLACIVGLSVDTVGIACALNSLTVAKLSDEWPTLMTLTHSLDGAECERASLIAHV